MEFKRHILYKPSYLREIQDLFEQSNIAEIKSRWFNPVYSHHVDESLSARQKLQVLEYFTAQEMVSHGPRIASICKDDENGVVRRKVRKGMGL